MNSITNKASTSGSSRSKANKRNKSKMKQLEHVANSEKTNNRNSCQEMASLQNDDNADQPLMSEDRIVQHETNVDENTNLLSDNNMSSDETDLPDGWEQHTDRVGPYYWHVATGVIQRHKPNKGDAVDNETLVLYHDDEEINQGLMIQRTSSEEDDFVESGAALTLADESTLTLVPNEVLNFIVYPIGCCEFDETQIVSTSNTRAIQKCILRVTNSPSTEGTMCWGLDQSQPILMRLHENYIQFMDIKAETLFKSQPINTIKTWAVDDDNNFAFVIEERPNQIGHQDDIYYDSVDHALLTGPNFVCYVFSSMDDDDMSCRVAAKLNEEINKYKRQISARVDQGNRIQQMVYAEPTHLIETGDATDDDQDELEETSELTLKVTYIGKVHVPRPMGIDVLNVAIDKCLADATKEQINTGKPMVDANLHVSPSSVIVEIMDTGEIAVECRIRYLTFMGISRRDIRWCGFIMQNTISKNFEAHCFECHPTAGHVCEAIQASCSRMYAKMVKSQKMQTSDATSIIPKSSRIRDTLAKTLSKIKRY